MMRGRRVLLPLSGAALLAALLLVAPPNAATAFLLPSSSSPSPTPAAARAARTVRMAQQPELEEKGPKLGINVLGGLGRSLAAGSVVLSTLLGTVGTGAGAAWGAGWSYDKQTVQKQVCV